MPEASAAKKRKAISDAGNNQPKGKKWVPIARGKNKACSILADGEDTQTDVPPIVEGIALQEWEEHFNKNYTYNSVGDDGIVREDEEYSV